MTVGLHSIGCPSPIFPGIETRPPRSKEASELHRLIKLFSKTGLDITRKEILRLVQEGADIFKKDASGATPYSLATNPDLRKEIEKSSAVFQRVKLLNILFEKQEESLFFKYRFAKLLKNRIQDFLW